MGRLLRFFTRRALPLVALVCAVISPPASASLVGDNVTGCFSPDASTHLLTLDVTTCLAGGPASAGIPLSFTVIDPGVEYSNVANPTREADFGPDTISIIYANNANALPDLFLFTDLDVPGGITGLTLIGTNTPGITTAFNMNSIGLLVPDVCNPGPCNFSVTYRIESAAVPEPASLALLGLGLAGLAFSRRKQA